MSSLPKKKKLSEEDIEDNVKDVKPVDEESDESEDESEDCEEDSDEDMDTEDKQFINKEIDIDFSAYPAIDEDINGMKQLLGQLWLKEKVNVSELTQLLVDQNFICSVLKQDEDETEEEESDGEVDEDVYGITSIIPLISYSEKNCIKQLKETLLSYIPKDNEIHKLLSKNDQKLGLIVNERFANLPPKISLPSYQQLLNDLKSAETDKKNTLNLNLKFEWFLMVCKLLKTKTTKGKESKDSEVIYVNAEEEIFDDLSDDSFEYSVGKQCDSDVYDWKDDEKLLEPFRKVLLLSKDNWNKAINKLKEEFK